MSDVCIDNIEFNTSHTDPGLSYSITVNVSPDEGTEAVRTFTASSDSPVELDTPIKITYTNLNDEQHTIELTIKSGESSGEYTVNNFKS